MKTFLNTFIISLLLIAFSHSLNAKKNHLQISLNSKNITKIINTNTSIQSEKFEENSECSDLIHFTYTFDKANNQLNNIAKKFDIHKHIYTELIIKNNNEGNLHKVEELLSKEKYNIELYIKEIEEIRSYINTIIKEIQNNLSENCKEKMKEYTEKMKENIRTTLEQIK